VQTEANYEFYLTFEEIQSQQMGATAVHNISSNVGAKKQCFIRFKLGEQKLINFRVLV